MTRTAPRMLILDTDPGVDDALAMLYLRAHPGLKLAAITTVFGNADVDTTTRNALYLRQRLALDVPVHQGAAAPLARHRGPSPAHVHGQNALGDIDLGDFVSPGPDPRPAFEAIADLVLAHPGEVTLVAIGPLTNLALALRAAPKIAGLVAEVVIMGGAFGSQGRSGNVTPFAEANIHNDPEAAAEVFAASWPITLAPLDATMSCVLTNAQARDLAEQGGDAGRFAHAVSRGYAAAYARHEGLDGCVLHDVAALSWLTRPELFEVRNAPVAIATSGPRTGQTRIAPEGHARRLCLGADGAAMTRDYLDVLRARP